MVGEAGAWVLEHLLRAMEHICEIFASFSVPVMPMTGWSLGLFLLLFLMLLCARKAVWISVYLAGLSGICILWWIGPRLGNGVIGVICGGEAEVPVVLCADPGSGAGYVVNMPEYTSAMTAADFFEQQGISRCGRVYLTGKKSVCGGGLEIFEEQMPVDEIQCLEKRSHFPEKHLKMKNQNDMFQEYYPLTGIPGSICFSRVPGINRESDGIRVKIQTGEGDSRVEKTWMQKRALRPELMFFSGKTLKEIE